MTTQALTLQMPDVMTLGEVLAKSGYFSDARQASQAVVKVLAGQELGFGPIASMTGIHIIQGQPSVGANLIASQLKRNPRYDYEIVALDDDGCTIAISENGTVSGQASFTTAEAKNAGLLVKDNWKRYLQDMLFARAISRAARRFAPDVFSGVPVYVPDELGAVTDENGDVIDVTPDWRTVPDQDGGHDGDPAATPAAKPSTATNGGNGNGRPLTAERVREVVRTRAGWQDGQRLVEGEPISDRQRGGLLGLFNEALGGMPTDMRDKARHDILNYLLGVISTNDLYSKEASALIRWLKVEGDEWRCNDYAKAEAARVIQAIATDADQLEMEM